MYESTMKNIQKKILVSVDFTPSSEAAIEVALKFASMHKAEMVLLHVIEAVSPVAEFFADGDLAEKKRTYSLKMLDKLVQQHHSDTVPVSRMVMEGKPYKEILRAGEEIDAEMIVMGTWGSHAIETGMIGSNVDKRKIPFLAKSFFNGPEMVKLRIRNLVTYRKGLASKYRIIPKYYQTDFLNPRVS